jgi:hypothetical protein
LGSLDQLIERLPAESWQTRRGATPTTTEASEFQLAFIPRVCCNCDQGLRATAMSWREERDALIAQTLAFVQSVTGKPADFAQLTPSAEPTTIDPQPSDAALPHPPAEQHIDTDDVAFEVMRAEAAMIDAAMRLVSNNPLAAAPPANATNVTRPDEPTAEFTGEHFTSITSELGLQRDMQTEIRARVASFRAHQERFNRERQEYFSSTLAKLRASMDDVPHSDK